MINSHGIPKIILPLKFLVYAYHWLWLILHLIKINNIHMQVRKLPNKILPKNIFFNFCRKVNQISYMTVLIAKWGNTKLAKKTKLQLNKFGNETSPKTYPLKFSRNELHLNHLNHKKLHSQCSFATMTHKKQLKPVQSFFEHKTVLPSQKNDCHSICCLQRWSILQSS